VVEDSDEMIAVIDRDYRYLIANEHSQDPKEWKASS